VFCYLNCFKNLFYLKLKVFFLSFFLSRKRFERLEADASLIFSKCLNWTFAL
jgi:hypothetical protein